MRSAVSLFAIIHVLLSSNICIFHNQSIKCLLLFSEPKLVSMRGRGILVVEGLITRRTILNEVTSLPPWVVSTQVRALSTAQEKANTRAMLDRMLRFNLLYKCYMLQMIHNQCLAVAGLWCVKNCHQ